MDEMEKSMQAALASAARDLGGSSDSAEPDLLRD